MKNPRFSAYQALKRVQEGSYIQDGLQIDGLGEKDRHLAERIVYGTVQNQMFLDHIIDRYVKKSNQLQDNIRLILRSALYQIHFLDRVPNHAIVDESVNMTKIIANRGAASLVNGVLRQVLRDGNKAFKIVVNSDAEYLSIKYSFPLPWVHYFKALLKTEAEDFFASTFHEADLTIRPVRTSKESLCKSLEEEGFLLEQSPIRDEAIIVRKPAGLFHTEAYRKGLFYVQDGASQKVVDLFSDNKDAYALDLCAAPGGKSFQMAERFKFVDAYDVSEDRLRIMADNIRRLGYLNIQLDVRDAKRPLPKKSYDRILVDAPCSGLGLLKRKPEIKYRLKLEDLSHLVKTQRILLENAYSVLKEKGEIVYSTCTVTAEENEGVLRSFLSDHPECDIKNGGIRYWPHRFRADGFTMACIVRKES